MLGKEVRVNNTQRRRKQRSQPVVHVACACRGCSCLKDAVTDKRRCHACTRGEHRAPELSLHMARSRTLIWRMRRPNTQEVAASLAEARRRREAGKAKHWWQRVKK